MVRVGLELPLFGIEDQNEFTDNGSIFKCVALFPESMLDFNKILGGQINPIGLQNLLELLKLDLLCSPSISDLAGPPNSIEGLILLIEKLQSLVNWYVKFTEWPHFSF